jgi:galactokinase
VTAALDLFRERFGGDPAGTWIAPGRANLIGEHTDYNEGFVLPFAIDRATTAAVRLREDRRIRVASTFDGSLIEAELDDLAPGAFSGWSAYPLGVAWAFGEFGADLTSVSGFELAIDSTVPVGAGLSSSAAIEMATAVALDELWGAGVDRTTLARIGQRAENVAVGAPTGVMDQSASVFGKADSAVFLDCRSLAVEQVALGFAERGLVVLVTDTRVEHAHATGGYRDRREACERGAAAMGVPALRDLTSADLPRAEGTLDEVTYRRVRHVVTEDERVVESVAALKDGDLARFGALLDASHVSMRDDFEISVPELDTAVEAAHGAGAIGARMTGGGFGGSAIALVAEDRVEAATAAILAAFGERGFREPVIFPVTAADGARRLG